MMLKYHFYKILRLFHLISKKKYKKRTAKYTREYKTLARSKLFDKKWYLETYANVKAEKVDPIEHYLNSRREEGYMPSPFFDGNKYLSTYFDVATSKMNPLVHYELFGRKEQRAIYKAMQFMPSVEELKLVSLSGFWDEDTYVKKYMKKKTSLSPIEHFCMLGWKYNYSPSSRFSVKAYLNVYKNIKGINPLYHYEKGGKFEGYKAFKVGSIFERVSADAFFVNNSVFWNKDWYSNKYKIKKSKALNHFLTDGWKKGYDPSPWFSTNRYLKLFPELVGADINPLYHYEKENKKRSNSKKEYKMVKKIKILKIFYYITKLKFVKRYYKKYRKYVNEYFFVNYNLTFKKRTKEFPLVTVIVPNYNHEKYLATRLDSIYNQKYLNFEVILLDDCSSDNSRNILMQYAKKYPDVTTTIFNEKNSGGVFFQWKKGLSLAKGEIIWIAESDDYCSDNFLAELAPKFQDDSIMLAFARTVFVRNGEQVWSQEEYLYDIQMNWHKEFVETAHNLVNKGFGYKNIVPNVSGCLFRNTHFEEIINNDKWYKLKLCGDWIFYLSIIKGGKLAYNPKATNYYRLHESNTSGDVQKEDLYFKEHQDVSMYVAENYKVNNEIFYKQKEILKKHWQQTRDDYSEAILDKLYSLEKIIATKKHRKPNILMALWAFSSGGGETFPIFLSNQLKAENLSITLLNYNGQKTEEGVRALLRKDIPIINLDNLSLKDIICDNGIDIIQSQHASVDWFIAQQKAFLPNNCYHIVVLHGMYETIPEKYLALQLPLLKKNVDRWLYIADKNLEAFNKFNAYNEKRFFKIANGLPSFNVLPISRDELKISKDAFVFITVSRGIIEKGWCESVEALIQVRKKTGKDIHLVLVGNGDAYEKLKNNVPDYVHLVGFQKDTRRYMAMSDAFLLASRFKGESFPLVIIDALLCNKPVIASDIGEIKNMLSNENKELAGEVFSLNNWKIPVDTLADIMIEFVTKQKKYKEYKKIASQISSHFDISKISKVYQKHYDEVKKAVIFCGAMKSQNFDALELSKSEYAEKVGLNTGNLVIGEYARKTLDYNKITESGFPLFKDMDIDEINDHQNIVIFATNWIAHYMKNDFSQINKLIKDIKIPINLIGLGSHTPYDAFNHKDFVAKLNPTLVEFIRLVSEKCNTISVRGNTTAALLKEMGIYNVDITGCPTWFVNGHDNKKIIKKELNYNSKILFHCDPEKREYYQNLFEIFEKYENSQLLIQSEFELLKFLENENVTDFANNFRLKEKWLKKKDFACCYTNISEWENVLDKVDFSFGFRIHGTIVSLKRGVPAIIVAHDGRTREMADFFSIPQISINEFKQDNFSIEKIYEEADFSAINSEYPKLLCNYINFLEKNGIQHKF